MNAWDRFARGLLASWLLWTAAGCGSASTPTPPSVFPAKGIVTFKGGAPVPGGAVEFRSKTDPTLTMMSAISPSGEFELFTIFQNERLSGAIPGPCVVTIHPVPKDMSKTNPPDPIRLAEPYVVEPKDNFYKIEIAPAK